MRPASAGAIVLTAAIAAGAALRAQGSAVLTGRVSDTTAKQGVPAAIVRLAGTPHQTLTDDRGEFRLGDLPPGSLSILVRAIGYRPIVVDVVLEAGDSLRLPDEALVLRPSPIVLAGIDVRADSILQVELTRVGFYERRARGFGVFAERREIGRWVPRTLSDVLRHLNGVQVVPNPNYGRTRPRADLRQYLIQMRGCGSIGFFLNGGSLGSSADPLFDVDLLVVPQDISAIEVYRGPSEIPLQFNATNTLCGAILLWSE